MLTTQNVQDFFLDDLCLIPYVYILGLHSLLSHMFKAYLLFKMLYSLRQSVFSQGNNTCLCHWNDLNLQSWATCWSWVQSLWPLGHQLPLYLEWQALTISLSTKWTQAVQKLLPVLWPISTDKSIVKARYC